MRTLAILALPGILVVLLFAVTAMVVGLAAIVYISPAGTMMIAIVSLFATAVYGTVCISICIMLWRRNGWGLAGFALLYGFHWWVTGLLLRPPTDTRHPISPGMGNLITVVHYFCLAAFLYVPMRFWRWLGALGAVLVRRILGPFADRGW